MATHDCCGNITNPFSFFHGVGLIGCIARDYIKCDRPTGCNPFCFHVHRLHSIHCLPATNHSNLPLLKVSQVASFVVVYVYVWKQQHSSCICWIFHAENCVYQTMANFYSTCVLHLRASISSSSLPFIAQL